jgi:DNA-binding XRE family transcriptional regulator
MTDIVASSIEADWGNIRFANKQLARLINGNESTIKSIRLRKNCPSLLTAFQLAPHVPTLRQRLAELLGVDTSASSEAKRIQLAMKILAGESHVQELSNRLPQLEGLQH